MLTASLTASAAFWRGRSVIQWIFRFTVAALFYSSCQNLFTAFVPTGIVGRIREDSCGIDLHATQSVGRFWPTEMRCYGITLVSLNATTQLTKLAGSGTKSPISRNYLWHFGKDQGAFSLNLPRK